MEGGREAKINIYFQYAIEFLLGISFSIRIFVRGQLSQIPNHSRYVSEGKPTFFLAF